MKIHNDLIQGTDEWLAARCGLLTASELKLIITPAKLQMAKNDKASGHLYEMAAQRITKYVEPVFVSDDMLLRGLDDEKEARRLYSQNYAPVTEVGFITNDRWGFTLGYSPDGLVGDDGLIECKSRRQKFQVEVIISHTIPAEHLIQVQAGLMIAERKWMDYISFSAGMPMCVIRAYSDPVMQDAIIAAAASFEEQVSARVEQYYDTIDAGKYIATERIAQEMYV